MGKVNGLVVRRLELTSRGRRQPEPLRVVLSRELDLPAQALLWDQEAPTLVAHGPEASAEACGRLDDLGVERLALTRCAPVLLLKALAARGCNQVLWECGPALAAAALREGCVQEVAAVIAPKLLGGKAARTALGELGAETMAEVALLNTEEVGCLEGDLLWRATVEAP